MSHAEDVVDSSLKPFLCEVLKNMVKAWTLG